MKYILFGLFPFLFSCKSEKPKERWVLIQSAQSDLKMFVGPSLFDSTQGSIAFLMYDHNRNVNDTVFVQVKRAK